MNKPYTIKTILSVAALSAWIASLFLPVFQEGGAGSGSHSGGWVLFLTFTWGVIFLFGFPWAILNIGFFLVLFVNLSGQKYNWLSAFFLAWFAVVTILTFALAFYGITWRYGMFVWYASMYIIGFTSYIDCDKTSPLIRTPQKFIIDKN